MTVQHNDLAIARLVVGDEVLNLCSYRCVRVVEEHFLYIFES